MPTMSDYLNSQPVPTEFRDVSVPGSGWKEWQIIPSDISAKELFRAIKGDRQLNYHYERDELRVMASCDSNGIGTLYVGAPTMM